MGSAPAHSAIDPNYPEIFGVFQHRPREDGDSEDLYQPNK